MKPGFGIRDSGFGRARQRTPSAFAYPESRIPNPGRARYASGFSLLEVIVAILLLAVAFAALMRVAGGAAGLTRRAAAHDEAAMWARSLLDSAFVLDAPTPGVTEGRFDDGYRWRLQVSPWMPPGAAPDGTLRLYRLDLDVSWGASSHPDHARFSTLRAVSATPGNPSA